MRLLTHVKHLSSGARNAFGRVLPTEGLPKWRKKQGTLSQVLAVRAVPNPDHERALWAGLIDRARERTHWNGSGHISCSALMWGQMRLH